MVEFAATAAEPSFEEPIKQQKHRHLFVKDN